MNCVQLESRILYYNLNTTTLITQLDIPLLTKDNIHYGNGAFSYTTNVQATSIHLNHILLCIDADGLEQAIQEYIAIANKNKRSYN